MSPSILTEYSQVFIEPMVPLTNKPVDGENNALASALLNLVKRTKVRNVFTP